MMRAAERKKVLVGIMLIGFILIATVVMTALAAELRHENNILIKQYETLQGEVDTLSVKIKSANNIDHLESVAKRDLGMIYPTSDECVYITDNDAPAQNFAAVLRREAYAGS